MPGARRNLSSKLDAEAARAEAAGEAETDGLVLEPVQQPRQPQLALAKAERDKLKKELQGKHRRLCLVWTRCAPSHARPAVSCVLAAGWCAS
jgi:hypothetical protein